MYSKLDNLRQDSEVLSSTTKHAAQPAIPEEVGVNDSGAAAGPSTNRIQNLGTSAGDAQSNKDTDPGGTSQSRSGTLKRRPEDQTSSVTGASKRRKKLKEKQTPHFAQPSRPNIRKLAPPRPFPTVPTSVSATGPRSARSEGKNRIVVTRRTQLGMYLRRCKDVVLKDGYKTLHLHAMGAAIPHLARLAVSLPSILPYAPSDIQTEVLTGTTEVQDEVIPDDEDEDITCRIRGKSTLSVTIKIEGGDEERTKSNDGKKEKGKRKVNRSDNNTRKSSSDRGQPEQLVFAEAELMGDDL